MKISTILHNEMRSQNTKIILAIELTTDKNKFTAFDGGYMCVGFLPTYVCKKNTSNLNKIDKTLEFSIYRFYISISVSIRPTWVHTMNMRVVFFGFFCVLLFKDALERFVLSKRRTNFLAHKKQILTTQNGAWTVLYI